MDPDLQPSSEHLAAPAVAPTREVDSVGSPLTAAVETPSKPPQALPNVKDENHWRQVDPRMQIMWRIEATVAPAILLVISLVLLALGHFKGIHLLRTITSATSLILGAIVLAYPTWWARRVFEATQYRLDAENFERRHGVFWRENLALPLNRLQHVDLKQGPLDRYLGLATLCLYTAGSQRAVHEIRGLQVDRARALRAALLGKRHHDGLA